MKKILVLLLCFNIVLAPTYAFANTPLGGWTITSQIAQGSSLALEATKNILINGSNVLQNSTAKIKPTVGAVSKVLARGAAGYALSVAVEQLIGSVDWVLDPANNQILYTQPLDPNERYVYTFQDVDYTGADAVCNAYFSKLTYIKIEEKTVTVLNDGASVKCSAKITTSCYQGTQQCTNFVSYEFYRTAIIDGPAEEQKSLPLDVVAAQVISNADTHADQDKKVGAQAATTQAAQDMLVNDASTQSDVENQLNTNAKTQTSEEAAAEATPKDPTAPEAGTDIKITFPVFCSWAPSVCQAANVVINFPTTLTNWWNTATQAISASWLYFKEWLDWTKNESDLPDTEINQVTELPIPELQENAISWSASCPPDVQVPINLYGQSSTLTFSWSPWCQLLNVIKPAIIASAYIGAAFIVLGLRT